MARVVRSIATVRCFRWSIRVRSPQTKPTITAACTPMIHHTKPNRVAQPGAEAPAATPCWPSSTT